MSDFSTGLYCSLGETAWTDLFSNQTQLSGFDPKSDIFSLFSQYKLPDKCVSSFLHESVHNICFQSPVGYSAAYLHFTTLLAMVGVTDPKAQIRANLLRAKTLYQVMRPLAEGLALFCEFDVAPRPSDENWSHSMWWLYFFTLPLHQRQEVNTPSTFGDSLYLRLMNLRSSKESVRHKQSMLLHPLDNRRGGYLSGYMTVKRLWYWSAIHCGKFNNREFFMRYLVNYFYGDPSLVCALHSRDFSEIGAINSILGAFQLRLREFFSLNFEEEAEKMIALERAISTSVNEIPLYELGEANEDWPLAREELKSMMSSVSISSPVSDAEHLLRLAGRYMAQRELLCLAQVAVDIRKSVRDRFEVLINGEILGESTYRNGVEGREGKANLACYVSIIHKRIIRSVTQGLEILSLDVLELGPSNMPTKQIESYFLNFPELKRLNDNLYALYNEYETQHDPEDSMSAFNQFVDETISKVYARYALYDVEDDKFLAVYNDMKSTGFLKILGSIELAEALAVVALGASLTSTIDDVINKFVKIQPNLRDQLPMLDCAAKAAGFTFYVQQSSAILSFV